MEKLTLKELAVPMIKAIDSFNYLLKNHHRRVGVACYHIGRQLNLDKEELLELVIAATLHDIGALSIQERDMLVKEDVENPEPHCLMGYQMLSNFEAFRPIAKIIRHHHIRYEDALRMNTDEVDDGCFILHLADRVDVLIAPDEFILMQKARVTEHIRQKVGTVFHPKVFEAFLKASKSDIFWIDINNMTIEQLFDKLDFTLDFDLTFDMILDFAQTISKIIDFRSRFTVSHSYTVAQLAGLIGTFFRWDEVDCKKLKIAGYLHDVGKIGIDPGIIEKPGKLTDEEFQMIKLHPYFTDQILHELNESEWFKDIVDWAGNHHENIQGTGYPHALSGDEVHEGTKILAFSDVITALMEDRPYRKGMPIDEAFSLIKDNIASKISMEIFEELQEHKTEIDQLVAQCKLGTAQEYKDALRVIAETSSAD